MLINDERQQLIFDIVYCGPSGAGKTVNLNYVKIALEGELTEQADSASEMVLISLGAVRGYQGFGRLWAVSGKKEHLKQRGEVTACSDAIIFVADSGRNCLGENVYSWQSMVMALAVAKRSLEDIPLAMQYNKRDLSTAMSVEELQANLNSDDHPYHEAIATEGLGVFNTLGDVLKRLKLAQEARSK